MRTVSGKFLAVVFGFTFYAIILFLILGTLTFPTPLLAQTNAPAGVGAGGPMIATNGGPAFNAAAPVRIDPTRGHVGGNEPADMNWRHDAGGPGFGQTLVTVLVSFLLPVTVAVFLPLAIIAIMFYTMHRRNKLLHENLRAMIDKGMPITPELVESLKGKHSGIFGPFGQSNRTRRLLPGLILTGLGAAMMIDKHHLSGGGLIICFIGIAFVVVWLVERIDSNNIQPPKQ